jgi:hypothetical protein
MTTEPSLPVRAQRLSFFSASADTPPLSPDDERDLDALLDQASRIAPSERSAFLERSCPGRPALRQRVEQLLAGAGADVPTDFLTPLGISRAILAKIKRAVRGERE